VVKKSLKLQQSISLLFIGPDLLETGFLFVLVISFYIFFRFWLRVLDYADQTQLFSRRETLLSSRIVSYGV